MVQNKSSNNIVAKLVVGLIGLFFVVFALNHIVSRQVANLDTKEAPVAVKETPAEEPKQEQFKGDLDGEITGWRKLEPNRQFVSYYFFIDGKEIARFKTQNDEVFDFEGQPFTGKVAFRDFTTKATGTQEYRKGERHGKLIEYYESGAIRYEAEYQDNKIMKEKEYFVDGILRMEADYTDASQFTSVKDVGFGRVNFRNGDLRYEWRYLGSEFGGYNKSYNTAGELVEEKYFDSVGQPVTKEQYFQNTQGF